MEKPSHLKKGDKIVIVSTARKISKEDVLPAFELLTSWGLSVNYGKNLFREQNQFAGTVNERISDLQDAINDDSIKAILCARGGYGTVQLVDSIDFSNFIKNPKWIIGYSDVTVLHNHVNQNFGIETIHATMPINFPTNTKESLESLKDALFGQGLVYSVRPHSLNRYGEGYGALIGGNLSILYSLTGTTSQISTKGKILFIEDLDEYLYHIDRMMMNLKRAGMLSELKGLIVGTMSDMHDNKIPFGKTAQEIILNHVKEFNYPVCFNFPAGHSNDNRTLIFGREIRLKVDKKETSLNY